MPRPQQPESERSGHTDFAADPASEGARTRSGGYGRGEGPVPPDNQPGHHTAVEQDKPQRPPPTPSIPDAAASDVAGDDDPPGAEQRFPFRFDPRLMPAAAAFGVLPPTAYVEIDGEDLHVRFGPWSLRTPRTNVRSTEVTGPYRWWKVAGPPHLSLADRGITFATTTETGLCIRFHEPVTAALPTSWLRHPAATVTVDTPHALAEALTPTTTAAANRPPRRQRTARTG